MARLALVPITTKLAKAIVQIQIHNDDFEKVDKPNIELYRLKKEPLQRFEEVIKEIINEITPTINKQSGRDPSNDIERVSQVFHFQKGALVSNCWSFILPLPITLTSNSDPALSPEMLSTSQDCRSPEPIVDSFAQVAGTGGSDSKLADPVSANFPKVGFSDGTGKGLVTWQDFSVGNCRGYLLESSTTMRILSGEVSFMLIRLTSVNNIMGERSEGCAR